MEGRYERIDEFSTLEQHLGTDKVAQKKAIGYKWVYTKKQGSLKDDTVRYKARLVAKSYTQRESIDYNEAFSHVVKHSSI